MTDARNAAVAAIDIGTNSTRLLVCDASGHEVARHTIITRLGQGVDAERRLHGDAIDRTCAALAEFATIWSAHDVDTATGVRIIATSASRDAANRDEFFDRAQAACGVRPELVSGDTAAGLAFAGATAGLHPHDGPFLDRQSVLEGKRVDLVGGRIMKKKKKQSI